MALTGRSSDHAAWLRSSEAPPSISATGDEDDAGADLLVRGGGQAPVVLVVVAADGQGSGPDGQGDEEEDPRVPRRGADLPVAWRGEHEQPAELGNWKVGPFRHTWVFLLVALAIGAAALAVSRYYNEHYGHLTPSTHQQVRAGIGSSVRTLRFGREQL